ncbi:MAG: radical SAM protein [Anaerovorax sp.]|nr:radical SAM protein [Anaerovorax sp.]
MKVLLTTLNSKYIHSNLALKYLYVVSQEKQSSITIKEFTINNDDDYIFSELIREDYDFICFSCYIWNRERILYLIENLKKAKPQVRILLGGPEVSFDPVQLMMENESIDFIISGEGEEIFPAFLEETVKETPDFSKILGLTYRFDDKVFVNSPAPPVQFDLVPFPYLFLMNETDKVLYYESSRGCPFSCSYCLSSLEKSIRALPMDRVKTDLSYFVYKKVKQVKFIDRTFNYDKERCIEILRYLMETDNGITNFHFELCGDLIDDALLELMENVRPGLFQFEIGVQSTNEKALKSCNRSSNFSNLARNVKRLREFGTVHLHLDLIAGLPYENYDSFRTSFNDVYSLNAHQLQLGFLKLLKGTAIRFNAEEHDYIYRSKAPYEVISNHYMSAASLVQLKMIESVLDLYFNRGGFEDSLEFAVKEFSESPFDFYEEFSHFYYLKGYQHRSHKKEDLYRIFYYYGRWKEKALPGIAEKLKNLLEWDMHRSMNPDAVKKFNKKGWDVTL